MRWSVDGDPNRRECGLPVEGPHQRLLLDTVRFHLPSNSPRSRLCFSCATIFDLSKIPLHRAIQQFTELEDRGSSCYLLRWHELLMNIADEYLGAFALPHSFVWDRPVESFYSQTQGSTKLFIPPPQSKLCRGQVIRLSINWQQAITNWRIISLLVDQSNIQNY